VGTQYAVGTRVQMQITTEGFNQAMHDRVRF